MKSVKSRCPFVYCIVQYIAELDRVVDGKPTSSLVMLLTANFLVVEQVDVGSHFQWTLSLNTTVSPRLQEVNM